MSTGPTLAGYQSFIQNVMGISTTVLPTSNPAIPFSFDVALAIVNRTLSCVSLMYTIAVYNLAGDWLINVAQDQPDAPNVPGSKPPAPFFANMRQVLKIDSFIAGVVQSSGDEGTNQSLLVQDAAKDFTLDDLQRLKTPWGRQYLAIAQKYGPSIWAST